MKGTSRVSLAFTEADYIKLKQVAELENKPLEEVAKGLIRGKLLDVCRTNENTATVTDITKGSQKALRKVNS